MIQRRIKGLYAITPDSADAEDLQSKVEACLAGGAAVIQYRNKNCSAPHVAMATMLASLCRQYGAALIVNDDVNLAQAAGASGIHLGRDDVDIRSARQLLGNESIIGVSCYGNLQYAYDVQKAGANYVAFGSMFASATKPHAPQIPLSLLTRARAQLDIPIVAIGGITLHNAAQAISAGADSIAVISALFNAQNVKQTALDFTNLFETN